MAADPMVDLTSAMKLTTGVVSTGAMEAINQNHDRRLWVNAQTKTTSPVTVTTADTVLLCDATGGAITVNLPAAAGADGMVLTVKRINSGANAVTLDGSGAETIDGAATLALGTQYHSATIACNGIAWYVIHSHLL
jgi:hypothetical protein